MGKHSKDTPEQTASWVDASYEASQARAEAKREADPVGELVQMLKIKGTGSADRLGRGGHIGISADGKTARRTS